MYINFWYPIARSTEVTAEKPLHVELLNLPFVAFRDEEGEAHVLADTCVHRGGALSAGWVKAGCVVCPYHGWQFDGDGKCVRIPSLGGSNLPARAKVDSYPVQERYGIVFAFLGDLPESERPPIYDVEEFGAPGWKSQLYVIDLEAYYERSMENGLDPIHNEFVHPMQGTPMLSAERQRQPLPVEDIPWGSKFYVPFDSVNVKKETVLTSARSGERRRAAGSWHQGPNQLVTWIDLTECNSFHQYLFEAPVDEGRTRIFFLNLRNWLLEDKHDEPVEKVTLKVVEEDVGILERLNPVRTPESNAKETLMPSDGAVARYREWLRRWEANGWRIDVKAMRAKLGDVAMAVPCPARRESGNWVLDPVPLLPATEAAAAEATAPKELRA